MVFASLPFSPRLCDEYILSLPVNNLTWPLPDGLGDITVGSGLV